MELLTDPSCIGSYSLDDVMRQLFLQAYQSGAGSSGGTYTSNPSVETADGTIPVGARGWSITALSGTVTVNGSTLPTGATLTGGGYLGLTLGTAIEYTIDGGSAAIQYDT